MAVLITKTASKFNINLPEIASKSFFADDNRIADYAIESVYIMQTAGIINGRPGNLFDPKGATTRGEMAKVMYSVLEHAGKISDGYKVK